MFRRFFKLLVLGQLTLLIYFLDRAQGSSAKVNDLDDPACKAEGCERVHVDGSCNVFCDDDLYQNGTLFSPPIRQARLKLWIEYEVD